MRLALETWSRQIAEFQTGRRGDLSDFEDGMVVGARQAPLSISVAAASESTQ